MKQYFLGIRGAVAVSANTRQAILQAARKLLLVLIKENKIKKEEVISCLFSATANLDAAPPALAARRLGWMEEALICLQEMKIKSEKGRYIRILLQVVKNKKIKPKHVYLDGAEKLRPDLALKLAGI